VPRLVVDSVLIKYQHLFRDVGSCRLKGELSPEEMETEAVIFIHIPMSSSGSHSRELVDTDPGQDFVIAPGHVVSPVMKFLINPSQERNRTVVQSIG